MTPLLEEASVEERSSVGRRRYASLELLLEMVHDPRTANTRLVVNKSTTS